MLVPVCFTISAGPDPSLDTDNCSVVVTIVLRTVVSPIICKLEAVMDPVTFNVCAVVVPVNAAFSIGAFVSIKFEVIML